MSKQQTKLSSERKKEYIFLITRELERCNDLTAIDFVYAFLWRRRTGQRRTEE